jgi:hypothetical protein
MRFNSIFYLAGIFFCFAVVTQGKQVSGANPSSPAGNSVPTSLLPDCAHNIANNNESATEPVGETGAAQTAQASVNFEYDFNFIQQKQSELDQCLHAADPPVQPQSSQGSCLGQLLLNFEMRHDGEPERDIPIGRIAGNTAFFYESGMTIDADGAPNAYHPDNSGLDDLANAGTPGRWEALAKDADGSPFIQGPDDPFPGYYVSETALADRTKPVNDPARYVDASRIPFVVLPGGMARQLGARPGDFAVVSNKRNGKNSYAIFADVGPYDRIGEGSVALAENLGIRSDARNGGSHGGVVYLVFPGSGNGRPRQVDEINAEGQKLLLGWEASIATAACASQ